LDSKQPLRIEKTQFVFRAKNMPKTQCCNPDLLVEKKIIICNTEVTDGKWFQKAASRFKFYTKRKKPVEH